MKNLLLANGRFFRCTIERQKVELGRILVDRSNVYLQNNVYLLQDIICGATPSLSSYEKMSPFRYSWNVGDGSPTALIANRVTDFTWLSYDVENTISLTAEAECLKLNLTDEERDLYINAFMSGYEQGRNTAPLNPVTKKKTPK